MRTRNVLAIHADGMQIIPIDLFKAILSSAFQNKNRFVTETTVYSNINLYT